MHFWVIFSLFLAEKMPLLLNISLRFGRKKGMGMENRRNFAVFLATNTRIFMNIFLCVTLCLLCVTLCDFFCNTETHREDTEAHREFSRCAGIQINCLTIRCRNKIFSVHFSFSKVPDVICWKMFRP